ncbi:MAG: molybdenum cofactor guanylyltransferase [Candidatus Bathyarchaeia archaeon]
MDKSAIILVGGLSSRFGVDKGLVELAGKPLIKHALDAVKSVADEILIVAGSSSQSESYLKVVGSDAKIVVDEMNLKSPLVGALTGFKNAVGEYADLLPCDAPFISSKILAFLYEICLGKAAVIPRWPNNNIEPLHAIYNREMAYEASKEALSEGKFDLRSMISKLRGVRYVSTLVLQQLDPELRTFFNVNTRLDLKRAEAVLKGLKE